MEAIFIRPVEIVFHILCVCRRGENQGARAISAALRKRGVNISAGSAGQTQQNINRITFWIRLCQAGSLLDEGFAPYPTLLVEEWLSWPLDQQIAYLLNAWIQSPGNEKFRRIRTELVWRLQHGLDPSGASQRSELVGLQSLGICAGEQLSAPGFALLHPTKHKAGLFPDVPPGPWQLALGRLVIPFPPDWHLMWELERFLDPHTPWNYTLDVSTLRLAAQRGALQLSPTLPEIVERGTGNPMPVELLQLLEEEPAIRLIRGFVLEFTHAEELKKLRQSIKMRRELDHLLSPRHVALDPWQGYAVLQRLCRKGLLSEVDLVNTCPPNYPISDAPLRLTKSEQEYILSLALLAEALQTDAVPPPGLLTKLASGLAQPLRASAARKASSALKQIIPKPEWQQQQEGESAILPTEALLQNLQDAIGREEPIDVLYQASGRHTPEPRHLTPLLVEQRGKRYYLIAYCHLRRANRTFRLDRLKLTEK